jgi:hypothetical protein
VAIHPVRRLDCSDWILLWEHLPDSHKMKTAEEWLATKTPPDGSWKSCADYVRAIQADALRHAADLCRNCATDIPSADFEQARHYCADWIEANAAKLEAK